MSVRDAVLSRVKPYQNKVAKLVELQDTNDIIAAILVCHQFERDQYDKICDLFDGRTAYDTGQNIWEFLKENVYYVVEKDKYQTVRSPGAIVATGKTDGADCKNYALFTGGIIDALNRKGAGIPFAYRFASYSFLTKTPEHVFVVLYPGSDTEIWIDPVLQSYDSHRQPTSYTDRDMLVKVSGVPKTLNGRRTMAGTFIGQGDGDDDDNIDFNPADDNPDTDPLSGSTSSGDTAGGDSVDIDALPSTQVSNGPDLTSPGDSISDPAATATANITDTNPNVSEPEASPNLFQQAYAALTGGSSSGGTSGGTGSSASTAPKSTSSTPTNTVTTNNSVAPSSNLPIILGVAAVAVIAIIYINRNK